MLRNKRWGERLRRAREKVGKSQEVVAREAGVSRVTLSKYENGEISKLDELEAITGALGVTFDLFFHDGQAQLDEGLREDAARQAPLAAEAPAPYGFKELIELLPEKDRAPYVKELLDRALKPRKGK